MASLLYIAATPWLGLASLAFLLPALLFDFFFCRAATIHALQRWIEQLCLWLDATARQYAPAAIVEPLFPFFCYLIPCSMFLLPTRLPFWAGALVSVFAMWHAFSFKETLVAANKAITALEQAQVAQNALEAFSLENSAQETLALSPQEEIAQKALQAAKEALAPFSVNGLEKLESSDLYPILAEGICTKLTANGIAPLFWFCALGPIGMWLWRITEGLFLTVQRRPSSCKGMQPLVGALYGFAVLLPQYLAGVCLFLTTPRPHPPAGWALMTSQARLRREYALGMPLAVTAWSYHAKFGGVNWINGDEVEQPLIGPITGSWNAEKLQVLVRHLFRAMLMAVALIGGITAIVFVLVRTLIFW